MPQVDFGMFKQIWLAANRDADAGPGNESPGIDFVNPVNDYADRSPSPTFEAGVPVFDVEGSAASNM